MLLNAQACLKQAELNMLEESQSHIMYQICGLHAARCAFMIQHSHECMKQTARLVAQEQQARHHSRHESTPAAASAVRLPDIVGLVQDQPFPLLAIFWAGGCWQLEEPPGLQWLLARSEHFRSSGTRTQSQFPSSQAFSQ